VGLTALVLVATLLLIAALSPAPVSAAPVLDGGWVWRLPLPDGLASGVTFVDRDHGWMISEQGSLMVTTDGGRSWMPQAATDALTYGPLGVSFPDASHGCLVGPFGRVAVTTDGGVTWTGHRAPTGSYLWGVAFSDAFHGWAVGDVDWPTNARHSSIVATTDGGVTWTLQDSNTAGALRAVASPDSLHGWAVGYNGTITATGDGGQSWVVQDSQSSSDLRAVDFVDDRRGWAVGSGGTILATADGGETWLRQASGVTASLSAVSAVDAMRCWVVGAGGVVLSTDDGGAHWTSHDTSASDDLRGVSFTGSSFGCIVGGDTILTTADGGTQWQSRSPGVPYSSRGNLYGLDFLDASTGWAVGQAGLVLKTVDGGVHWRRLENGNLWSLDSVHFVDAQHGWAVGDGFILASADGGSSWTPQTTVPGTGQRLHDLAFADATHAAAVGDAGLAFVSDDGGATWTRSDVSTGETLYRMASDGEGRLVAVGTNGAAFLSTDGGSSWSRRPSGTTRTLADVCLLDSTYGWAVGNGGTILTTSDGGSTWNPVDAGLTADLSAVAFTDRKHGWIGAGDSALLSTSDGGAHWTTHGALGAQRIVFTDSMHGCLVVYSNILTTDSGGLPPADGTAPMTTLQGSDGLWHADAQRLSLSAVDEAGGSGVASTTFRTDGEAWQSGTSILVPAPADHSNDGVHLITYFSVDAAGNAENPHTGQVRVDTTAPSTAVVGAPAGWQRGPVTLTLVPGDGAGSGVATTEYRLDDGAWTIGMRLTVSGDGPHTLACRSVDLAGNVEAAKTTVIRIDSTGPTTAAMRAQGRVGHRISLRYQVADALSSQATHLRIIVRNRKGAVVKRLPLPAARMGAWFTARWTPKVRGTYTYFVFARDEAGNSQITSGAARIIVR
jgi:photosystem II stability/assembly factor-like uncharacterized protein